MLIWIYRYFCSLLTLLLSDFLSLSAFLPRWIESSFWEEISFGSSLLSLEWSVEYFENDSTFHSE